MTRTVKHSVLALVGFVIVGTTILSWANRKESAQTEALPDPPDQIAASSTYAWVDKEHGVAAIPVSRAMDILGEKGLPWGLVPEEPTPAPVAAAAATDSEPDAAPKPAKPAAPKLDPERVQAGQAVFTKRCQ